MFSVSVSSAAAEKIKELLGQQENGSVVRIREYATGTPCARKMFLGLTFDCKEDDDVEGSSAEFSFIAAEDIIYRFGSQFTVDLCENKNFVVTAVAIPTTMKTTELATQVVPLCEASAAFKKEESDRSRVAINWETAEERLTSLKNFLLEAPQQMDPERMKVVHAVYEEFRGEPTILIRARLLERLLTTKKIFLDGNPIVGTLTGMRAGVYTYPEWNVDWIKDEMDMVKMSSLGAVSIPKETEDLLKETYKDWKGKTVSARWQRRAKELYGINAAPLFKSGLFYNAAMTCIGSGVADYARVLEDGFGGIIEDVEERLSKTPVRVDTVDKVNFYQACLITLRAAIAYANRYADLAEETAAKETDRKAKAELLEIAAVCRRVPEHPARTFREAVQAFWFAHLIICIEQMGCGTSLGRYGQYMNRFYVQDLKNGSLTRDQAFTLLRFQWIKHLELGVYQGRANALALSGQTGQNITLGGLTADGLDATTELEELLLDVQIKMKNIQPTLSLFYHPRMKASFLNKAVELVRGGTGQPQFINNAVVIQRHLARFAECGISLADARNCANFSCVSTGVAGKGSFVVEEHYPNLSKLIELTLRSGVDRITGKQIGAATGPATSFKTFEELYGAFTEQIRHMFRVDRLTSDLGNAERAHVVPSAFRSTLVGGCIEKGIVEEMGGATYSQSVNIVSCGIDAANSLLALKDVVFDRKLVSMERMLAALEANFEGHEDVLKYCLEAPKHGNGDPEIDMFVRKVYADLDSIYKEFGPDFLGHTPVLDAYSVSWHNYFGGMIGALPSGRKRGKALTDGSVSATPGTDQEGPTALISSAAFAIDTVDFGANHLNMKFTPSALEGSAGARSLLSLVKTYFDLGGCHIQFNCVKPETLLDAQARPEMHRDLVVRVAGFSAYFTRLDRGVQDEIIRRTEYKSA